MWGGRFSAEPDAIMADINTSIDVDRKLFRQDIAASRAHAEMLKEQSIISAQDAQKIVHGLDTILSEMEAGTFVFKRELEDIHMNVEARLAELIGPAAGRLHTARSRNDQVATDFRLWVRDTIDDIDASLAVDPNRREDMPFRVELTRRFLEDAERHGLWRPPPLVEAVFEAALGLPPSRRRVTCHGDLHFRHVLVDDGDVSGVIDWGDVCLADRAIDLPLLWSFVAPEQRGAFLDAYGPVNEAQLVRARVLALQLCATLAHYGRSEGNQAVERAGVDGLERTLAG